MGLFDGILGGIIGVEGATLLNNFVEKQRSAKHRQPIREEWLWRDHEVLGFVGS